MDPGETSKDDDAAAGEDTAALQELWRNHAPEKTRMHQFKQLIENKHNIKLTHYDDLYRWSIGNLASFWDGVWHFTGIRASKMFSKVIDHDAVMFPRPPFFQGARLNFAENLLYPTSKVDENSPVVIAVTEQSREFVSWAELRIRVRKCAAAMHVMGVRESDRVAGYVANQTNALVAMLAAVTLGAIWTGISPDTGAHAVLERLSQIEPVILFADSAIMYNGKVHGVLDKLETLVHGLPGLKAVVIFSPSFGLSSSLDLALRDRRVVAYEDFINISKQEAEVGFAQLGPNHPIYILYSSGTTGKPKCIVHGAIGTLIQHKKEHDIHCDIHPGDRFFYYTTCTWMMWHWLVSGLACGATIILYDGSPFSSLQMNAQDDLAMPRLIEELGITHFGTSAKYLSILEQKNVLPKESLHMTKLRAIYSTGSPLAPSTFRYVYRAFGEDINLGSITGGTDILSLFGAPSPLSPVYAGEVQARGLGMAVESWDSQGNNITHTGETGDLVCVKPFPSQPVMFWKDVDGQLYRKSYFDRFPGIWHHGDFIKINPHTGGLIMLGRSDGTLKPAGVRFGSAEIYNVLLHNFPHEIVDALCVGRRRQNDLDEIVVLFLKMAPGHCLTEDLVRKVKGQIRNELSARHVPGIIEECPDIPMTINGKKVEIIVKQIISGMPVQASFSVANAEILDWYRQWAEAHT